MHNLDFYLQKLATIHPSNLRRLAMMPTVPDHIARLVIPAINDGALDHAKKQLAIWLHGLEIVGTDPSATDWFIWLPDVEIPGYFDPYFDKPNNADKRAVTWAYRLTPRNKYRHALYTLRKQFPFSRSDYTWNSRDRLYKHLNSLGWHWETGRRSGHWSNVCF